MTIFPSSLLLLNLFSLLGDLFPPYSWLRITSFLLVIGCVILAFFKNILESMWGVFLYQYFSFVMPNLSYKIFFESSCCQIFYETFLLKCGNRMKKFFYLSKSSYPHLAFFYFWKTPLTLLHFTFLPSLILEPFISRFILRHLSIQRICNSLFLRTKVDFTFILVSCSCNLLFVLTGHSSILKEVSLFPSFFVA